MKSLRVIVTLGRVAHESTVRAFDAKLAAAAFGHGKEHALNGFRIFSSYHCSRYNTNTGVLTTEMFHKVFADVRRYLDA
jgi:uracil-DNA glycosylase